MTKAVENRWAVAFPTYNGQLDDTVVYVNTQPTAEDIKRWVDEYDINEDDRGLIRVYQLHSFYVPPSGKGSFRLA